YAPIFKLHLGMEHPRVFVGSRELVDEMADDDRFTKFTHRLHKEMRSVVGDGLFSAESTAKNWWKAHRLLVPAFGTSTPNHPTRYTPTKHAIRPHRPEQNVRRHARHKLA